jgi:hypothetical protein
LTLSPVVVSAVVIALLFVLFAFLVIAFPLFLVALSFLLAAFSLCLSALFILFVALLLVLFSALFVFLSLFFVAFPLFFSALFILLMPLLFVFLVLLSALLIPFSAFFILIKTQNGTKDTRNDANVVIAIGRIVDAVVVEYDRSAYVAAPERCAGGRRGLLTGRTVYEPQFALAGWRIMPRWYVESLIGVIVVAILSRGGLRHGESAHEAAQHD